MCVCVNCEDENRTHPETLRFSDPALFLSRARQLCIIYETGHSILYFGSVCLINEKIPLTIRLICAFIHM